MCSAAVVQKDALKLSPSPASALCATMKSIRMVSSSTVHWTALVDGRSLAPALPSSELLLLDWAGLRRVCMLSMKTKMSHTDKSQLIFSAARAVPAWN
jgi:hypothetical protein